VLCLQFDQKYLVTGSSDTTIIIWDIETLSIHSRLVGHSDSVLNLQFNTSAPITAVKPGRLPITIEIKELLLTASKDNSIRMWDMGSGECVRVLQGHRAAVNSVVRSGKYAVSGSGDRTIRVWDLETGEMRREIHGHQRGIACVQVHGNIKHDLLYYVVYVVIFA
jgi:WD40 repeat protein